MTQQPVSCCPNGLAGGILLTTIGAVLLMSNLEVISLSEIWHYWPVILIVIGVSKLLEAGESFR